VISAQRAPNPKMDGYYFPKKIIALSFVFWGFSSFVCLFFSLQVQLLHESQPRLFLLFGPTIFYGQVA
jgi:hypothetical protein